MRFSPKLKMSSSTGDFFAKGKQIGIILILLIILFLVLNLTGPSKEIKNFFYLISSPFQKTLWQMGNNISDFLGGTPEIKNLKKEVENLQLKNQELLNQIVAIIELRKENEILREALELGLEKDFQLELAQIIGKDPSRDSISINKGLGDGISKDMAVITSQKNLLGRIGEVYQDFSEVILISNKESSFNAKIPARLASQGETGGSEKDIYGVIKGKGGLEVSFELIPKEEEILLRELVITTTLGGIFPQGLLIGEIEEIEKSDVEPFQRAEIKLSFNLKNLDNLFIITDF